MTNKLNLRQISKILMEDMPQGKADVGQPFKPNLKQKASSGGAMSTPSYDKSAKKARTKPALPKKAGDRKPSPNSGPAASPSAKKIPGTTTQTPAKKISAPAMKASGSKSRSPFVDANKVKRSEAEPLKWSSSTSGDTKHLIGAVMKGMSQGSVPKIKINVSKPNINYGIVPTGEMISVSQSPTMKKVNVSLKAIKEGVINGTTTVSVGSRKHTFEAASVEMIRNMVHNYANVGQPVTVDIKVGLRESYADKRLVTSLLESIHAKALDVDLVHKKKLAEAYSRFRTLLENQYVVFHNRSKKKWVAECLAPAFKQAYGDFKRIYESHLQPYEVTMNIKTKHGVEIVDVVTSALNENVAMHSAVEEIASEYGPSARFNYGYIGSKKYVAEDASSLLSKALKFDDMPEGFKSAGFGYKTGTQTAALKPKVDKLKASTKKRDLGATVFSPKAAPGKNAEKLVDRKGADKRDKTPRANTAPAKAAGPRWAE